MVVSRKNKKKKFYSFSIYILMNEYSKIIKDLEADGGVEGGFVVSRDGLLIYTDMENLHTIPFAAMAATILSSAEFVIDEINEGIPRYIVVKGKNKSIVVVGAGKDNLLAVVVKGNVEDVIARIEEAAKKIASLGGKK